MTWQAIKEKNFYLANIFLGVGIIAVTALYLLRGVSDPDFFWHLKSGEWIVQNKALPAHDPFSYTTPDLASGRAKFILTSYWLSQVVYHLIHRTAGMPGIIFFHFLVFGAIVYVLIRRRQGDQVLYLGLLLIFAAAFFQNYSAERPQVFSFLFFGVLLLLLDRIRQGVTTGYYGLPVLMLFWGNSHPGFILGQAVIALYMVMEGVKFLKPDKLTPITPQAYRNLLFAGGGGIVCSFINPNTYHPWLMMMDMSPVLTVTNSEYLSSIESFVLLESNGVLLYWFMLLLTAVGILMNVRKIDITETVLLAVTGYFSFTAIRYVAFFLIAAVPAAGRMFSGKLFLAWARSFLLVAAIFISLFFSKNELSNINNVRFGQWVDTYQFPVHASEFISSQTFSGNMFNDFTMGGYLIWRLGTERKVFFDGRNLSESVHVLGKRVEAADTESVDGLPFWKSVLISCNVGYIIIPFYDQSTGEMVPLVKALLHDKDWEPVYIDLTSVVFVKDAPENRPAIAEARRRSIKKEIFGDCMLYILDKQMELAPGYAVHHIAKGDVYFFMQRIRDAREEYEAAANISSFNATVKQRLMQLSE